MLRNTTHLQGFAIQASDGVIGHVEDCYFDDAAWVIRYFVVDTGSWLASRKVLISPIAIAKTNWTEKTLSASITRKQVQDSPAVDTEKPVSQQHEMEHLRYYGYPYYWGGIGLWGQGGFPNMLPSASGKDGSRPEYANAQAREDREMLEAERIRNNDPHLRSSRALIGYYLHATDGDIGHVQGVIVDDSSWAVRYLVVDTNNWWLDHEVLISPKWIDDVSWLDATVSVGLTRQSVKSSPPYDSKIQLTRKHETDLHLHYDRPDYWGAEEKREALVARI